MSKKGIQTSCARIGLLFPILLTFGCGGVRAKAESDQEVRTIARTVVLKEEFRQGADIRILGKHIKAVRADGTSAEVRSAIDPATGRELRQQRVVLYADGRKIIVQDSLRAKSTFYRDPARHSRQIKASLRDPRAGCLKTLDGTEVSRSGEIIAGEERIGDLMTVHSRVTQGQTLDIWYAPSLGCEIVRQVVTMDGGMQSIQNLESYRGDAEDMTLFAEPEDYEEVAPSEAAARMFERMHGRRPAKLDDGSLEALDKEYSASRRR